MAQFQRHFVQELTKPLIVRQCGDLGFSGDNLSDVISVDLYTDGVAYSGGGTCAGACICPDGSTVALTGSVSGKTASVTLTEDCFAITGQIGIAIRVTSGTTKTTVLKANYNVEQFSTNNPVDPGSRTALDVGDLVNRIDAATADIPASDMASLMAGIAPTFSTSTAYPAGAYVYYNGTLYRFISAHAAGSWTGTDATAVALANDVADIKGAVDNTTEYDNLLINTDVISTASILTVTYTSNDNGLILSVSEKPNWLWANTSSDWCTRLTPGTTYKFSAKCSTVSGNPFKKIIIRGTSSSSTADAVILDFTSANEQSTEFVATQYMRDIVFLISNGSAQAGSSVKYYNLLLAAVDSITAIDKTARSEIESTETDIDNLETALAETNENVSQNASNILAANNRFTDPNECFTNIGIIERPDGINLLVLYRDNIENGKYFIPTTNQFADDPGKSFAYIPVKKGNKTYSLLGAVNVFGPNNVIKIPIFDNNKNFISYKYGTLDANTGIVTIVNVDSILPDDTGFAGYSFVTENKLAFFVEGVKTTTDKIENYLDRRITVDLPNLQNNVLNEKTAVFLGDSICAADTVPQAETDFYQYGWAGRIGVANNMTWHNYGISGGSITRITGRSCIQDRLAMAYANYPNANYFIFEGGVNDADVIGTGTSGYTKGTFDPTDYTSEYDTTSFCGSLETFIRNIITKYPDKKIGYIIPCKMGTAIGALANRRDYFDTAKAICKKWGVPVIDVWERSVMNPKLETYYDSTMTDAQNIANGKAYVDGQHPTDVGYDIITPIIERWMKTI